MARGVHGEARRDETKRDGCKTLPFVSRASEEVAGIYCQSVLHLEIHDTEVFDLKSLVYIVLKSFNKIFIKIFLLKSTLKVTIIIRHNF